VTTLEGIFGLRGHRALVTGASSGLGIELAEALAIAGADVALVARREDRLREVAHRLEAYGRSVAVVGGDLSAFDSIPLIVERCEQAIGPVDILVNNAGLSDPTRAEKVTLERWKRLFDINVTAVFLLCQEFARRRFQRSEGGRIVNVGSIFALVAGANPGLVAYTASKGAVGALSRQLAIEWADRGITVNSIAPGYFPTELNEEDFAKPHLRERVEAFIPLGRGGRPGELRAALLFLVSPAAGYVTGSTVFVDGGYTAW
jgi:NAD(P)-dependent dehydrogenase (short-subunit alcohol dehydrogenase family)